MSGVMAAGPQISEVLEAIDRAMERSGEPVTASKLGRQLTGPFRLPPDKLSELLEEQVRAGRLFRFAAYMGKSPRYWHRDHAAYARQEIERELDKAPLSVRALQQKLSRRLSDCGPARQKAILEALVREGRVRELPTVPRGRTVRYSVRPPAPEDYTQYYVNEFVRRIRHQAQRLAAVDVDADQTWKAACELLEQKLAEVDAPGVSPSGLGPGAKLVDKEQSQELTTPECPLAGNVTSEEVLVSLRTFWQHRRPTGPVSVRELRQACWPDAAAKPSVDAALLELARAGRVILFRHDYPGSLNEAQRQALVADAAGNLYNAIALKE